jgi:predicted glycoside hydrolase/deacetylase ChbG (UPF0249 family)
MLNEKILTSLLERLPEGTWELVCHPGYNDSELRNSNTRLLGSRQKELQVLTSAEMREVVRRAGIELVTYRDLSTPAYPTS